MKTKIWLVLWMISSAAYAQMPLPKNPGPSTQETPTPAPVRDRSLKAKSSDLVNLDFVNADIAEITKSISELTKRNFILDDQVHGKITIISPKPVTVEEAYQAYISALAVKNYTVVPAGKMLKIVPLRDMRNNPIPTDVEKSAGGDDAYITKLIPVRFISASEIVKSLRNLLTKNGDVMSYDPTNTLIITDAIGNLRRMEKIIRRLDQQGYEESLEVIHLKFSSAADVAEKIRQIFDLKGNQPGGAPPPQPGAELSGSSSQFISKIIPDDRTNSIIVMANREGIRRVKEVVHTIDQSNENEIEKGRIHVHYLQYADATELVGTLSSLTGGGGGAVGRKGKSASSGGSSINRGMRSNFPVPGQPAPPPPAPQGVGGGSESATLFDGDVKLTADIPTNALVITATSADYKGLLPVIRKLDIRRPQAFIEAMILEVDVDKALNVGVVGHMGTGVGDKNENILFGATGFGGVNSLSLPSASSLNGLAFGLQGRQIDIPVAGGTNLSIPAYGALFQALQSNGTINLLSTPNILTSDNKEAEIIVGQVVPFITSQGSDINGRPINQINRENVAITLRVTPQINASDDVTMEIFQEIQDLVPGADVATFGPTTSNRSAKTTVLVKDGQTVTVGGLIADREQVGISKVPILGDIPLLGWLFKSKTNSKRKTSLAILLTPHIVREPEDLQAMSIKKNVERQKFLNENNVKDHPGIKKYDMDKSFAVPGKVSNTETVPAPIVTTPAPLPTPLPSAAPQVEPTPMPTVEPAPVETTLPQSSAPSTPNIEVPLVEKLPEYP